MSVISGHRPAPRRRALRQPADPRCHGRRRRTARGRLAHDPRYRRRRLPVPRQRRDRRDEVPDRRPRAADRPRQRRRRTVPRLPRRAGRLRARRTDASSTSSTSATAPTTHPRCPRWTPWGSASQQKAAADGTLSDELGAYAHVRLRPGETIVGHTCGGGGYGPPDERDPQRVVDDIRQGWITAERALTVYGVTLDADGEVDLEVTLARRSELAAGA